jgi:thiol-disulfide isomerase/thioredoxin
MKLIRKIAVMAAIACMAVGAFAQVNPKDVMKDVARYRTSRYAEFREGGKAVDAAAVARVNEEIKFKVLAATRGVDLDKVDAKDAYDWAQLLATIQRHEEVCSLTHKFLTSNPTAEQKFAAQMLMMRSCNALGEADMLMETLQAIVPTTFAESEQLSNSAWMYSTTISKKAGIEAALKTLAEVESSLVFSDPKEEGAKLLEAEKKRLAAAPNGKPMSAEDEAKRLEYWTQMAISRQDQTRFGYTEQKAELLIEGNRRNEALAALDAFLAKANPTSPTTRNAKMFRTRTALMGAAAPALTAERSYNNFSSLAGLKGKVVIIDTFAHWCGPCIASFPSVRKMYDELKGKGLEIVGVTTYYGYYKAENREKRDMDKDTEYARMADFMKEHNMNWKVVYGPRENFENYGVTGIPTVFLLDRQGNVREIHVGYSPESFAAFRKEVEKLLNAK